MARKKAKKKPQPKFKHLRDDSQLEELAEHNVLQFFGKQDMPQEIFLHIFLFVPAYPDLFLLRRVSKSWKAFIEQKMYDLVRHLDFSCQVSKGGKFLDKMGFETKERFRITCDMRSAIKFLIKKMPNITTISIEYGHESTDIKFEEFKNLQRLNVIFPFDFHVRNSYGGYIKVPEVHCYFINGQMEWNPMSTVQYHYCIKLNEKAPPRAGDNNIDLTNLESVLALLSQMKHVRLVIESHILGMNIRFSAMEELIQHALLILNDEHTLQRLLHITHVLAKHLPRIEADSNKEHVERVYSLAKHIAIDESCVDFLKALLENTLTSDMFKYLYAKCLEHKIDISSLIRTALYYPEVFKFMLKSETSDPHTIVRNREIQYYNEKLRPLEIALRNGLLESVKLLLDCDHGVSNVQLITSCYHYKTEVDMLLIVYPIISAKDRMNALTQSQLLERDKSVNMLSFGIEHYPSELNQVDESCNTILHQRLALCNLTLLLAHVPEAFLNRCNEDGDTPIHFCISFENMNLLCLHGANRNICNKNGISGVMALCLKHTTFPAEFLESITTTDLQAHDAEGNSLLHHIFKLSSQNDIDTHFLLQHFEKQLIEPNKNGHCPWFLYVNNRHYWHTSYSKDEQVQKKQNHMYLQYVTCNYVSISSYDNLQYQDNEYRHIHSLMMNKFVDLNQVSYLKELYGDLNATCTYQGAQYTPLMIAIENKAISDQFILDLIAKGAKGATSEWDMIEALKLHKRYDAIVGLQQVSAMQDQVFLDTFLYARNVTTDMETRFNTIPAQQLVQAMITRNAVLHWSQNNMHMQMYMFLKHYAKWPALVAAEFVKTDEHSNTAMHYMAKYEAMNDATMQVINMNETPEAILDQTGQDKKCILHFAALGSNIKMSTMLVRAGAQKDATDAHGKTPFDYYNCSILRPKKRKAEHTNDAKKQRKK